MTASPKSIRSIPPNRTKSAVKSVDFKIPSAFADKLIKSKSIGMIKGSERIAIKVD